MSLSDLLMQFEQIVGPENFEYKSDELTDNTLGIERDVLGFIYPSKEYLVKEIVLLANRLGISLYPISRGMNIGYGDKLPWSSNQLVVDLSRMTEISDFDPELGRVHLEPGVTQGQLYRFLIDDATNKKKDGKDIWRADVTGASTQSSIIGNTLDGGFGHTPIGFRRKHVNSIDVILGSGDSLTTSFQPAIGPDLNSLFIQSNLGIVTGMNVELYKLTDAFESFRISFPYDSNLEEMIDTFRELRQNNLFTSLVHVANPLRLLLTTGKILPGYDNIVISNDDAKIILQKATGKESYWSSAGGLYGTHSELSHKKKYLRRVIKDMGGSIDFYNDGKFKMYGSIIDFILKTGLNPSNLNGKKKFLEAWKEIHDMMQGIPTDMPSQNIHWRVPDYSSMGLLWVAPAIEAKGDKTRELYDITQNIYAAYGFEMPMTMTFIDPNNLVCVLNINFDKTKKEETEKAHSLYHSILEVYQQNHISLYRQSNLNPSLVINPSASLLRRIKGALDPKGLISPLKYGV